MPWSYDVSHCELFHFFIGELLCPIHALGRVCAGAGAVVLRITCRGFVGRVAPVVPAGRNNVISEPAVDVGDAGRGAPGAAE